MTLLAFFVLISFLTTLLLTLVSFLDLVFNWYSPMMLVFPLPQVKINHQYIMYYNNSSFHLHFATFPDPYLMLS